MKIPATLTIVALSLGAQSAVLTQDAAPPQETAVNRDAASPEDPHKQALTLYQQGISAYQRKDYLGYLENLQKAVQIEPDNPAMLYRLASASALVGNKEDACAHLKRVIEMKIYQDLADNPDFDSMNQVPEYQALAAAMKAIKNPISRSVAAFHLIAKDLITEGIAYDPVKDDFFIGSVHMRKILRTSRKGKAKDFTAPRQDGLGAVLGLKVDPVRRLLWACSTGMAQMEGATQEEKGRAALFKYDLETGAFVKKYPLGGGATGHNCNDLTIGSGGDVYVSDSESGEIYMLPADTGQLKILVEAGRLASPQGIALSADEKQLFVADYASSIFSVDRKTGQITPVGGPPNLPLMGIDGLVFHKDSLIAIQNGINPHRVVRLTMSPAMDRIVSGEILEMNNPLFDEPTLGTVVGNELFYIANSQWGRFTSDGTIFPMSRLAEPVILKMKLVW